MFKKFSTLVLFFLFTAIFAFPVKADERDDEIAELKAQVQQLMKRIEVLEQNQAEIKETAAVATAQQQQQEVVQKSEPNVLMDKIASKLKIKGRWVAGYFDSGKAGSYPSGSFEVPDAKIIVSLEPDEINKIVMRLNLSNATFNNVDYSYIDTNLTKWLDLPLSLNSRIGRMKVEFGEETIWNNPLDSSVPSNSAINADGKDEGLGLYGKLFGKDKPLSYWISVTNGTSGTGSDASTAKAFAGKLAYNILDPFYMSASYYNSGSMKSSNAEMSLAGLTSRPTGAIDWTREIWEVDFRYDFEKGKVLNPPAFSDSKAILQYAYGGFRDDVSSGAGAKRTGQYGFIDGLYNLNKKWYIASRASVIKLDDDTSASLNSITCNEYQRYSLGLGYRLTANTLLKLGYDWNIEFDPTYDDADNDLFSVVVASQF